MNDGLDQRAVRTLQDGRLHRIGEIAQRAVGVDGVDKRIVLLFLQLEEN
jgi:hypothetical protein